VNRPSSLKIAQQGTAASRPQSVPLLDLSRQYAALREEILAAIERVCASQHFILGDEVEAFENALAEFTGASAAVGCASGTDAVWLALMGVGVHPGDEVITTAFSFFASASAIVRSGARPIFVDVDPRTLNIDPAQVQKALRARGAKNIRAVLPVHLYGQCADIDALQQLADEFKLFIVEDAAQAIGAAWRGRRAGSMGAAAAFSFYPSKNLSAYGDAGSVTTSNVEIAEHMRRLRNQGSPKRYFHEEIGWNSRLDAIQAAVLRLKLPYVNE
jgi:dTDP-4-amino-4,6-dideoxygalactose transaminase